MRREEGYEQNRYGRREGKEDQNILWVDSIKHELTEKGLY